MRSRRGLSSPREAKLPDLSNNTVFFETDASNTSGTDPSWPEGMLPSKVNDSARALQGAAKRFYDHINGTATSGGSANAQTLTYTVAPTAYVAGDRYTFKVGPGLTNTGATSLNVNGLGAVSVAYIGNALVGGELRAGQIVDVVHDGTNFQLVRPMRPAADGFTPNNPTGVAGAAVMMGIGSTCAITPLASGQLHISLAGDMGNSSAGLGPNVVQLRYGTGTAPTNGAAVTGTAVGSAITLIATNSASGDRWGFACNGQVSGLTVGTAYWIDISLSSTVGTSTVQNLSMLVRESPR